ncbi:MAG TPA: twin-arginine translocation signal domain-containing protein [Steroidobacteraceae bacterium]|nr:twin-arginine translocation signal domain-containing protein [Steroidobacteraceae bacterium]
MTRTNGIARRDFLKSTGILTGLLAVGSPLALLAPSRTWAVDLTSLTSDEGATLLSVTRTIAMHDKLDDAAYALVVQSIDADCAKDAATRKLVKDGLAGLGAGFAKAGEARRVAALKEVEPTPFFQTMRIKTISTLYASPLAYAYFGYEGEAFSKGGYLARGFNDLRWLPDPPLADSGPVPGQG